MGAGVRAGGDGLTVASPSAQGTLEGVLAFLEARYGGGWQRDDTWRPWPGYDGWRARTPGHEQAYGLWAPRIGFRGYAIIDSRDGWLLELRGRDGWVQERQTAKCQDWLRDATDGAPSDCRDSV